MSHEGKGRQSAKHKRNGKYSAQFARTIKRIGRWRGKWIVEAMRKGKPMFHKPIKQDEQS